MRFIPGLRSLTPGRFADQRACRTYSSCAGTTTTDSIQTKSNQTTLRNFRSPRLPLSQQFETTHSNVSPQTTCCKRHLRVSSIHLPSPLWHSDLWYNQTTEVYNFGESGVYALCPPWRWRREQFSILGRRRISRSGRCERLYHSTERCHHLGRRLAWSMESPRY